MNSLRKTVLALTLLVVPAAQAWEWPAWVTNTATAVASKMPSREHVSKFATDSVKVVSDNPKTSAGIAVGTAAVVGGLIYAARTQKACELTGKTVKASTDLAKSAYNRFANLSKTQKAGLIAGTGLAVVASIFAYKYFTSNQGSTRPTV